MVELFWLSTILPGMALASLADLRIRRTGLLGALCWWFILSVCSYSALTVLAFLSAARPSTAAVVHLAVSATSLVVVWRRRDSLGLRRLRFWLDTPALWVAFALIAPTLLLPGSSRYDAQMHAAKIVLQQIEGYRLQDPFSPLQVAHSSFHVNAIHFLHGIGVALTGVAPLDFWQASAPFFRLVEFGGVQLLALHVFRNSFVSSMALMAAVPLVGLDGDNAVPATVASYALLPALLVTLSAYTSARSWPTLGRVAVCSIALPAVHVGHAVLYLVCLLPALALALWIERSRARWTSALVAAVVVLTAPTLPLLGLTAMFENHAVEQMGATLSWEITNLRLLGVGLQTINLGSQHWILPAATATALLMLVHEGVRRRFAVGSGALVVALQLMFNPLIFAAASYALPFWMMRRASAFAALAGFVSAAGLAWLCRGGFRGPRLQAAAALAAASIVVGFSTGAGLNRLSRLPLDADALQLGREVRDLIGPFRGRPLVMADRELSLLVPAIRPAAVMAPSLGNTNPADPQLVERAKAQDEMLSATTTQQRRQLLAERYHVEVLLLRKSDAASNSIGFGPPIAASEHLVAFATNARPR